MQTVVPDRRILKAFYTQYVAVLLIILVFTAGGFNNAGAVRAVLAGSESKKSILPIGEIDIRLPTVWGDNPSEQQTVALLAVSEVLKNHDVLATLTISSSAVGAQEKDRAFNDAVRYAELFRSFLLENGVPADTLTTIVNTAARGDARALITFSPVGGKDEK